MERVLAAVGGGASADPTVACAQLLRASAAYPVGEAALALRASFAGFESRLAGQRARIVRALRALVDRIEPGGGAAAVCDPLDSLLAGGEGGGGGGGGSGGGGGAGGDADADEALRPLFECADRLRESTETCIDEARGDSAAAQEARVQQLLDEAGAGAGDRKSVV